VQAWMDTLCSLFFLVSGIYMVIHTEIAGGQALLEGCEIGIPVIGVLLCTAPSELLECVSQRIDDTGGKIFQTINKFCSISTCQLGEGTAIGNWQNKYKEIQQTMTPSVSDYFKNRFNKQSMGGSGPGKATEFITGMAEASDKSGTKKEDSLAKQRALDTLGTLADQTIQFWPSDVSESLVLSIVFLCPRGVILNLEKYRQILCNYGLCYLQMSSQGGPLKGCEDMKSVQTCLAVTGELFNVIPYGATLSNIETYLETVLNDPLSLTFYIVTIGCNLLGGGLGTSCAKTPKSPTEAKAAAKSTTQAQAPQGQTQTAAAQSTGQARSGVDTSKLSGKLKTFAEICRIGNYALNAVDYIMRLWQQYTQISQLIKNKEDAMKQQDQCEPFDTAYEDMKA